jgi:hypothetical protein
VACSTVAAAVRRAAAEVAEAPVGDGVGGEVVVAVVEAVAPSDWAVSPGRSGRTNPNAARAVRPPTHRSTRPGNGFQLARLVGRPCRVISLR